MTGLLACVLSGFALALLAPWLHRPGQRATGAWFALLPVSITGYLVTCAPAVAGGASVHERVAWVPGLGVELSFHLDGLSLLFALSVSGVGAAVLAYSASYVAERDDAGRFYAYLLVFMASMLGLVLADDVVLLYVFFEATSVASFLLIGFDHTRADARAAARQALLVTSAGGLALLAGGVLLSSAGASDTLSTLVGRGEHVRASPSYLPILGLILAAAFAKSAQLPFSFWLPNAMIAPTPVSAYLHSAALVKAGIYLLARLSPVLGGTPAWRSAVIGVGALTMVGSAWLALRETDLKRLLAHATLMALGLATLLLGVGSEQALRACVGFVLAHACYKAALFMVAGALQHATGRRDLRQLSGLRHSLPASWAVAAAAALAMAGLPPTLAFVAKEASFTALLGAPLHSGALVLCALLANAALGATAAIVALRPFLGPPCAHARTAHPASWGLWLPPAALAALGIGLGLAPAWLERWLLGPAVAAITRQPVAPELALWHGPTPELALSALALGGSAVLYRLRDRLRSSGALRRLAVALERAPERAYDRLLDGLAGLAVALTRVVQSGLLRRYQATAFGTALLLLALAVWPLAGGVALGDLGAVRGPEWVLAGLVPCAALAVIAIRPRLEAIFALSVVGYAIALLYLLLGAPDVSLTQLLIETLTIVLLALVYDDLAGSRTPPLSRATRLGHAVLATGVGATITVLMLAALALPFDGSVSAYYIEQAPEAHARNVVNAILVDFRALDTLGEISVLGCAALGARVVLTRGARRRERT